MARFITAGSPLLVPISVLESVFVALLKYSDKNNSTKAIVNLIIWQSQVTILQGKEARVRNLREPARYVCSQNRRTVSGSTAATQSPFICPVQS